MKLSYESLKYVGGHKNAKEFFMNKKFLFPIMALVFGLGLSACVTDGGRYDSSIPVEQQASLVIPRGGMLKANIITSFDGQHVTWADSSFFGQFGGKFLVDIPAGSHTLTGMTAGVGEGTAKPPIITYDFLAGNTYRVEIEGSEIIITDITE
jgi:hypothetical protein